MTKKTSSSRGAAAGSTAFDAHSQPGTCGLPILGKERIEEILHDRENMVLPSSIQAIPKTLGDRGGGSLKAASWQTLALVNLPVTLIRLWGGAPAGTREARALDNFMHLVKAIRLALMPYMTPDIVNSYLSEMRQYLTTLLDLFPGTSITIYQHLALHLPLLLAEHGPTHAWRCWIVERMNHVLQSLHTNGKFGMTLFLQCSRASLMHSPGELEMTLFYHLTRDQALRSTIASHIHEFRPELREIIQALYDLQRNRPGAKKEDDDEIMSCANILFHDYSYGLLDEVMTWTEHDVRALDFVSYGLLVDWIKVNYPELPLGSIRNAVYPRDKIERINETYAPTRSTVVNHVVVFNDPRRPPRRGSSADRLGLPPSWSVGEIDNLFSYAFDFQERQVVRTFAIVLPYRRLSERDNVFNRYEGYGAAGGDLYYDAFDEPQLLAMDAVLGHATRTAIDIAGIDNGSVVHVIPFGQVRLLCVCRTLADVFQQYIQ